MQWIADLELEQLRCAVELARKVVAADPHRSGAWLALSSALCAIGEYDDAAAGLRTGLSYSPSSPELHIGLADVLQVQDQFEEALAEVDAALRIAPDHVLASRRKVLLLSLLKQIGAGVLDKDAALLARGSARMMSQISHRNDPADVLNMCDGMLAAHPMHTNAKYTRALALAKLDRAADAKALMNLDRGIWVSDLPHAADDGDAFRAALEREIRSNPTLAPDPRGKSTRQGLQTRQLRRPGAVAVEALLAQIRQAVDVYVAQLDPARDPFARNLPAKVWLTAWAVIYADEGWQKPHHHPAGWISGVYYVCAPRPPGENAYRGALVMGPLDPTELAGDPPWGTREIEPVPGRLVMFPSYFPHATEPTGIDGARISVAFDVVAVQ